MVIAGHRHAVGRGDHALEACTPVALGELDADLAELGRRERQDHVRLAAEALNFLETQDVGAAGGRSIRRHRPDLREPRGDRVAHERLEHTREPRRGALRTIDHVAGEHEDGRNRQHVLEPGHADLQVTAEHCRLPPRRAQVPIALPGVPRRLRVIVSGFLLETEDQLRFALRGEAPVPGLLRFLVGAREAAQLDRRLRERPGALEVVEQCGHGGRIDAGVVRVAEGPTRHRAAVRAFVQIEARAQVHAAPCHIVFVEGEFLVRAREHAQRLGIVETTRGQLPEQPVGAFVVAAPGECQRLQLREPDVFGPMLEPGLRRVVCEQRLAAMQQALGLDDRLVDGRLRDARVAVELARHVRHCPTRTARWLHLRREPVRIPGMLRSASADCGLR